MIKLPTFLRIPKILRSKDDKNTNTRRVTDQMRIQYFHVRPIRPGEQFMTITLISGQVLYCVGLKKAAQLKMINARDPSKYFYRKIVPHYRVCEYYLKKGTPPNIDYINATEEAASEFYKIKTKGNNTHGT